MEWSRIQPEPDKWDEEALEKYRAMLRGLHERGMTAMVTLHHFTDPLWLDGAEAAGKPRPWCRYSSVSCARPWRR